MFLEKVIFEIGWCCGLIRPELVVKFVCKAQNNSRIGLF